MNPEMTLRSSSQLKLINVVSHWPSLQALPGMVTSDFFWVINIIKSAVLANGGWGN